MDNCSFLPQITNRMTVDCINNFSQRKGFVFGNESKGCVWTCADLYNVCIRSTNWNEFYFSYLFGLSNYNNLVKSLIPVVGIVSNILLLITLFSSILKGNTFTFLRFISSLQLLQAIIMFIYSRIELYRYFYDAGKWISTNLVNSLRLMICVSSCFLTFERYMAVCCSTVYSNFLKPKHIIFSFIISIFIGLLQMEEFSEHKMTRRFIST
jgi:hypothetical protein